MNARRLLVGRLVVLWLAMCSGSTLAQDTNTAATNSPGLDQNLALKLSHEALGRTIGEHALPIFAANRCW